MKKNGWQHMFSPRKLIILFLLIVMIVSGIGVLREKLESGRQQAEQEHLAQLAQQTTEAVKEQNETEAETTAQEETESLPYVSPIDFETLRIENPDVIGWIQIPDTKIDYPILYAEDNETYLHKDFNGKDSVYGSIYLDCDSEPDFSGWNNPIYGHHMKDGSMFKDVVKFKDKDFFKNHQYFEIYTPERTIRLKAISCYYSSSDGIVRKTRFRDQDDFNDWLIKRLKPCSYAEIPNVPVDSVFILVTCSYEMKDARTMLYAVEVDEEGNVIAAGKSDHENAAESVVSGGN
ncbi:MAG: class B sortase [Brotaphodocola sp.]